MEETKHIKISDYNYPLPDERIKISAAGPRPVQAAGVSARTNQ